MHPKGSVSVTQVVLGVGLPHGCLLQLRIDLEQFLYVVREMNVVDLGTRNMNRGVV